MIAGLPSTNELGIAGDARATVFPDSPTRACLAITRKSPPAARSSEGICEQNVTCALGAVPVRIVPHGEIVKIHAG